MLENYFRIYFYYLTFKQGFKELTLETFRTKTPY